MVVGALVNDNNIQDYLKEDIKEWTSISIQNKIYFNTRPNTMVNCLLHWIDTILVSYEMYLLFQPSTCSFLTSITLRTTLCHLPHLDLFKIQQ